MCTLAAIRPLCKGQSRHHVQPKCGCPALLQKERHDSYRSLYPQEICQRLCSGCRSRPRGQALPSSSLFGARTTPWEHDGYSDKRVVRVYDPAVAAAYSFGTEYYWRKFDAARVEAMLDTGIRQLAGAATPADAWARILPGVSPASTVVVKVNLNNSARDWKAVALNTSPAMMAALARSLNQAGVIHDNIVFLDCSRSFPDEMKTDLSLSVPASGASAARSRPPPSRSTCPTGRPT